MASAVQVPISTLVGVCDCRTPAIGLCAWPMEKPVSVKVSELGVGDVICFSYGVSRRLRVIGIKAHTWGGYLNISVRKIGHGSRPFNYVWHASSNTLALRPAICDEPVCYLHAREVAEGRVYCSAHWNAWKDVA